MFPRARTTFRHVGQFRILTKASVIQLVFLGLYSAMGKTLPRNRRPFRCWRVAWRIGAWVQVPWFALKAEVGFSVKLPLVIQFLCCIVHSRHHVYLCFLASHQLEISTKGCSLLKLGTWHTSICIVDFLVIDTPVWRSGDGWQWFIIHVLFCLNALGL